MVEGILRSLGKPGSSSSFFVFLRDKIVKTKGEHYGQEKENRGFFLPNTVYFQIRKYSHKRCCFQTGNRTEGLRFEQTEGGMKWKEKWWDTVDVGWVAPRGALALALVLPPFKPGPGEAHR